MARWFWLKAEDGSYDSRSELRRISVRNPYDFALLVARLVNAQEFGALSVDEDRVLGTGLWFYRSGDEGIFYLLEDGSDGIDVRIVWVGNVRRVGFGEVCKIAEGRLAKLG